MTSARIRTPIVIFLCIAATAVGACTSRSAPNVLVSVAGATHEGVLGWKSEHDQTVNLASQGTVDVDVEAFAGDVTIVTDKAATETQISIRRIGTFGWGRSDDALASLGDIRYTVSLERNDGHDSAVVRAVTEHPEPHFQRVDVVITVPALGTVRVRSSRGEVWVEENRGPVDIVTSRGQIRVMTPWKMDAPMTLVTSDGDIDLRIRGESMGSFDIETVGGAAKVAVKYGRWLALDAKNDRDTMRATLNDGANRILLRTSNANAMVSVVPEPVSQNPFPSIW